MREEVLSVVLEWMAGMGYDNMLYKKMLS